jgi:hypothetical protein
MAATKDAYFSKIHCHIELRNLKLSIGIVVPTPEFCTAAMSVF